MDENNPQTTESEAEDALSLPPESWPAAVATFCEVGAHKIAVVDGRAGRSGPPLVFVHGIALSANLWWGLLQDSPLDAFPWISLGLPAHFPSVAPEEFAREDVTSDLFADCVATPAREFFGEQPVHLVGWSTGGFASLAAAAREPALAASIVTISGFARGRWGWHLGTMQFLARRRLGKGFLRGMMRLFGKSPRLFRIFKQSLAKQKLEVSDELMTILFEDSAQHDLYAVGAVLAGIRDLDLSESLPAIQAPVLILTGAKDRVIPASEAEHLHEQLPNSRLIEFPDVGHIFYGEALAENLEQICLWIEEHGKPGE